MGMPVTPSRISPQRASSARVSVICPAEMLVDPPGRVICARHRSYTRALRVSSGGVLVPTAPCSTWMRLPRVAASKRRTTRSMRPREPSATGISRVVAVRIWMLYPTQRAGWTHAWPALTVILIPPAGVTAKSASEE